jgi:molecular chaperone DnaJ
MMSDHYATLGIGKQSSPDEIKRAYRKLASQHHPDKGGDTATFQRIEEAYRILSDPQQRQQYDNPQPQFNGGGFNFNFGGGGNPFDDILRQFHQAQRPQQTRVYTTTLNVSLEQVARGDIQTISIGAGTPPFNINIPRGIESGHQLQYGGAIPNSNLIITFNVLPHRIFERDGLHLSIKYNISVWDLILGATISITDIYGNQLEVTVTAMTKPNTILRLGGRGLEANGQQGDLRVLLSPVIPDTISQMTLAAIRAERAKQN